MLTYSLIGSHEDSLYGSLYAHMKEDIVARKLKPGERLPSKRPFAQHLGVSLITVEHAYSQLIAEGYVQGIERRGYFVNDMGHLPPSIGPQKPAIPKNDRSTDVEEKHRPHASMDFTGTTSPAPSFPLRAWSRTMRKTLAEAEASRMLHDESTLGLLELRTAIAEHTAQFRGLHVDPSCVAVGAGAQYLYGLIVQILGRDMLFAIEDPGYRKLEAIYHANGANVACLPIDEAGLSAAALEEAGANVAHITPSHQFPTGRVMPISRRSELLEWAAEPGRFIIEDDYDCEFRLTGKPIPTLKGIDRRDKVIYLNTFTKSMSPGIRIAYLILPPACRDLLTERLGFASCTVSSLEQAALADFIRNGDFERHLNRMRKRYRSVQDAAIDAIRSSGAWPRLSIEGKDAGLHFILGIDAAFARGEIENLAARNGIRVREVSSYSCLQEDGRTSRSRRQPPQLVINYSGMNEREAANAARTLCRIIEEALDDAR